MNNTTFLITAEAKRVYRGLDISATATRLEIAGITWQTIAVFFVSGAIADTKTYIGGPEKMTAAWLDRELTLWAQSSEGRLARFAGAVCLKAE